MSALNTTCHRNSSYFSGNRLQELKEVINGPTNAVYITTALNCWVRELRWMSTGVLLTDDSQKASAVKMITQSVIETGACDNLQLGELTAYMRAALGNLRSVVSMIHDLIDQVCAPLLFKIPDSC